LTPGTYTIICRDNLGCSTQVQITLNVQIGNTPSAQIIRTNIDSTICIGETLTLTGNLLTGTTGVWSSSDMLVVFSNPNAATTTARFPRAGVVTIRWTLSTANCPNYSTSTMQIAVSMPPDAQDDLNLESSVRNILMIDVTQNDSRVGNTRVTLLRQPRLGIAELSANGNLTYTPKSELKGIDTLTYVLCSDVCQTLCDTARVTIIVRDLCDLTAPDNLFPQGITPDGDDKNQSLVFQIIDPVTCPFNQAKSDIQIFNRWGDRVFHAEPYRNDWDGKAKNGQELPVGVYYYVLRIRLTEPEKPFVKFGSVTIFR
jgi:gliding motility-associated-like protein